MTPPRSRFRGLLCLGLMLGSLGAVARPGAVAVASDDSTRSLTFETYRDQKEGYRWRLKSSNGQIIATSGQGYKDNRDCKNAIDRIKKDAATRLKFETYEDKAKEHRWRLKATNGQVIATSGQGYKDKRDCEHAIDVIKKGAEKAKVAEAK
ncbi:MAG: YegP family protein [Isosphaeraceae bacterium]